MEEFEPKRKTKVLTKEFIGKYAYIFVLAILLVGGISYGYTFFTENRKIASGSITTANLTINFTDRSISATSLSVPTTDQEGLSEFSKSLTITNQTAIDGRVKLSLTRTSGLALTDMKYAIVVNGAIQEIDDVPSNGEILSSAIMGNDTLNVEVRLWPKTTYSGSETTFVGEITPEIKYLGNTAARTSDLTGKYVNFNGNEVWQIVKVEDGRLVLTRQTDYTNATARTNSNRYNPSLTFNDNSLITSVSTDNLNVYLAKTTKITGGEGSQANPYNLSNDIFNEEDKKVIAVITYKDDTTTIGTQNIYYNETNYISQAMNGITFQGWSDGTNTYQLGDIININVDTILSAQSNGMRLNTTIYNLCDDANVTYVSEYDTNNGTPIDTPTGSGSERVCYYTSDSSTNLAGQNGNVIFGDYCWQIVRTTATGGTKLIYNGLKTNDNKCPNNNTLRPKVPSVSGARGGTLSTLTGNKLYGTGYEIYNDNGTNKFRLKNTFTANWNGDYDNDGELDYPKIVGTFSCLNTSSTCTSLYSIGYYANATQANTERFSISTSMHFSTVGVSATNVYSDTAPSVGYMYNNTYLSVKKPITYPAAIVMFSRHSMSNTPAYYYGDKATWNPDTRKYELTIDDGNGNDVTPSSTTSWMNIRSSVGGMYSCLDTTNTECAIVYYIIENSSNYDLYHMSLSQGETINTRTFSVTYGTGYTENNGIYTLTNTNTKTILWKDWYTRYNEFKGLYYCKDLTSTSCEIMFRFTNVDQYARPSIGPSRTFIYGNSVTYSNGSYIINTDSDPTKYQSMWDWYEGYTNLTYSHYTCFKGDSNDCGSSIYYIFAVEEDYAYYIELTNGELIEDALEKMLNINNSLVTDVNKYNSTIKSVVDNWYEDNLSSLTSYLDDNAVYCNDRSIVDYKGWSPNGPPDGNMKYNNSTTTTISNASLSCTNMSDRFSVNNNIAKLTYPVGLLTTPEYALMNKYYAKTGRTYWTISPELQGGNAAASIIVDANGNASDDFIQAAYDVRPVIVLKATTRVVGNGTYDSPYIVDIGI